MGGSDHRCEWRDRAEGLEAELGQARGELAAMGEKLTGVVATLEKLQRHVFGKRSEKIPRVADEFRDAGVEIDPALTLQRRRENAEKKPQLVPRQIERQVHVQEKLRCKCGETILTADPPARVYDKARFGPAFMAQVVVSKCADAIPLCRQAKAFKRAGVPIGPSTFGDLFHGAADIVSPLFKRLLEILVANQIVLAAETTLRVQEKKKTRTAWLWDFLARDKNGKQLIAYVFCRTRSGETPERVLGNTVGKLLVDGYAGYNKVTVTGGRERAGCMAHVRRKFFDALSAAPEGARKGMDFIIDLY